MVRDKDYLKLFSQSEEDGLTKAELSEIIDEELSKSEDEMDTELIESCLDAISRLETEKQKEVDTNVHLKKFGLRRWAAVAAAVAAVLVVTVSVHFLPKKVEGDVVGSEIYSVAEENGYGSLNLPAALLSDECNIVSVKAQKNGGFADSLVETKAIVVSFSYKGKGCKLTVKKQRSSVKGEELEVPELSEMNARFYYANGEYLAVYQESGNYYTIQMPVSLSEFTDFLKEQK